MKKVVKNEKYDSDVMPSEDEVLQINISLHLEQVLGVNEKDQTLSSLIYNIVTWHDERLAWDPHENGGIKELNVPNTNIWKPDIILQNSANGFFFASEMDQTSLIRIYHTGAIVWHPVYKSETYCQLDTSFYPFDTHTCDYWYSNWMHNTNTMTIKSKGIKSINNLTSDSTEWNILNFYAPIENYSIVLEEYSEEYSFSRFSIKI